MKRFAAHYLFFPGSGFLKQHGVEITDDGIVSNIFPLTEEIEAVEWHPGIIALLSEKETDWLTIYTTIFKINTIHSTNLYDEFLNHHMDYKQTYPCFIEVFSEYINKEASLFPYLFYPFDFISMQPVVETRHKLLR